MKIVDFPLDKNGNGYIPNGKGCVGVNFYKGITQGWSFDTKYWMVDSESILTVINDPKEVPLSGSTTRTVIIFDELPCN